MGFQNIKERYTYEQFEQVVVEILQRNTVQEDVLIRATIFVDELAAGTKIDRLKNSFSMYVCPLGEILPRGGARVCISSWNKPGDNSIPPRAKINGAYASASLMKNEALLNGFDEAIALDGTGHVAEATVANLFLVRRGELITPHSSDDILEGITRRSVFEIAARLGVPARHAQVDRTELYIADELFLCGSSARITPVLSVDHRPIGTGKPGAVTTRVAAVYDDIQHGNAPDFSHWLTPVTGSKG